MLQTMYIGSGERSRRGRRGGITASGTLEPDGGVVFPSLYWVEGRGWKAVAPCLGGLSSCITFDMGLLFSRWHGVERGRRRRRSRIQIHHARFGLHASLPLIAGRSCDLLITYLAYRFCPCTGRHQYLHAVRTFHDTPMAPSPCVCELG